jgi:hypothetical protein
MILSFIVIGKIGRNAECGVTKMWNENKLRMTDYGLQIADYE